jgi:hypothetical protein
VAQIFLFPKFVDPILLILEHLCRKRHGRRHPDMGQGHDDHLAPIRWGYVADDATLITRVRYLGHHLLVLSTKVDMLRSKMLDE